MSSLKIQHLLTLGYLLSQGARYNYIPVTTSSIGKGIQKSQQAASKHLIELEKGGYIERNASGGKIFVRITPAGCTEMDRVCEMLRGDFGAGTDDVILKGSLVSGMGEGAYYMSLDGYTKQFKEQIGYAPFPGTLNVRLDNEMHARAAARFDTMDGYMIEGFSDGRRTYGWVKCFAGMINDGTACHLIRLERTHHNPSIIEVISRVEIRKACGLKDGSAVTVKIPMGREWAARAESAPA